MSCITTHVLDISKGQPVVGMLVTLTSCDPESGKDIVIGQGRTDPDGRIHDLLDEGEKLTPGLYLLAFDTSAVSTFFPKVVIQIQITEAEHRYHIPLLLSPFGYSTYRGR